MRTLALSAAWCVCASAASTLAAELDGFALDTPTLAALSSAAVLQPTDETVSADSSSPATEAPAAAGQAQSGAPEEYQPLRAAFAQAGSDWLTFGAAYANSFVGDSDLNLHAAWSRFLADDLEFGVEAAAWYFAQDDEDTVGLSGSFFFRWHFLQDTAVHLDPDWTVFAEIGIGMLFALDEVPSGGTTVNFLPRIGGGFTYRLDDRGNRLVAGLRWHHVSNGRFDGDDQNPARDSLLLFLGVQVPF